jgi:hypothetical protein
MLVDLRRRGTRRDHLLLIGQVTVPTLIVLMTTVSCSDMREPGHRVVERELAGRLAVRENRQLVRRSFDRQPILGREQSKTSAPPKVAKAHAPARTGAPVSGRVLEKANTPPLLDAEKEQLFQEFLEWWRRHSDMP